MTGKKVSRSQKKWSRCSSPKKYKGLKPGKKTFSVRAVNSTGAGKPAKRTFLILKAKKKKKKKKRPPAKAAIRTIIFVKGHGRMTIDCPPGGKSCAGKISIKKGGAALVKKRSYSVKAGGTSWFTLTLTRAGTRALNNNKRVRADGTLTAKSGSKLKFIAILKRR